MSALRFVSLVMLSSICKSFGFTTLSSHSFNTRMMTVPKTVTMQTSKNTPLITRFASVNEAQNDQERFSFASSSSSSRRNFVASSLMATIMSNNALFSSAASAATSSTELKPFQDAECNFQLSVPANWAFSEQALSDRRKIVFFVDTSTGGGEDKTLIFIAYTPLRDDFTSLSSFGSVDQVAQATILPKGQVALMDDNESKMISAESKKNAYYFDYTTKVTDQPKRHFRTIFDLKQGATGGAGAVLVTVTAQTTSKRYDDEGVKALFDEIIDSYGKIPK